MDGIMDILNSKDMTEAGPLALIDDPSDDEDKYKEYLPGVQKGDLSKRAVSRPVARTKCVSFSPTNRSWAATTTEGLLVYSLDDTLIFDPFELDIDITPENITLLLNKKEYLKTLVMAFRLNEPKIIETVYESIPTTEIQLIVSGFPVSYVQKLLAFISNQIANSPHLEFHLVWCIHISNYHGTYMKDNSTQFMSLFRDLQKNITKQHQDLSKISDDNMYTMDYMCTIKLSKDSLQTIALPTDKETERNLSENSQLEENTTSRVKSNKKKGKKLTDQAKVQKSGQ